MAPAELLDTKMQHHVLHESSTAAEPRSTSDTKRGRAVDLTNAAGDAADDSTGVGLLFDGVNSLVDSLPALVKALDEVSKIHPYVGSAYRPSAF